MVRLLQRCVLTLSFLTADCVIAVAQDGLRFSDIAGTDSLVYPKGPRITVANPKNVEKAAVWVIRELDGAIVRKYKVPNDRIWKQTVEVNPLVSELTALSVEGTDAQLSYRLFLIGRNRDVLDTRLFAVRLKSPGGARTASWGYPHVAAGQLKAIENDMVSVSTQQGGHFVMAVSNQDTKVHKVGQGLAWKWPEIKEDFIDHFKPGDQVTMVYTEEEDGTRHINELVILATPTSWLPKSTPIDRFVGLLFQIATVVSTKEDTPSTMPLSMVVVTEDPSRRWWIRDHTAITRGVAIGKPSDLLPKTLIAVGVRELKDDDAAHVLLLKNLAEEESPR